MKRYFTWLGLWVLVANVSTPPARVNGSVPSPIQVTTTGGRHPTLSPNGRYVAYESEPGLAVRELATGHNLVVVQGEVLEPDWGAGILYRGGNPYGLWVEDFFNLEDECCYDPVFFTDEGFDDGAVWGVGGHHVVAQTSTGPNGDGLVLLAYPNGFADYLTCLEPDQTSCSGESPTESPDALWIAFDDGRVEKVPRNGGESVYVTTFEQGGGHPSWSPDGNWIAFVSYDEPSETSHIWVTDARGSDLGIVQLTDGDYRDDSPDWSHDSSEVYFTSNRSGNDEIWKVAFDPGTVPVMKLTWGKLKTRY